jgi:hypothetical protein
MWLGREPNLLPVKVEERGVRDILEALTDEEREQVERKDASMPIRFFRGEKGNAGKAAESLRRTLQWQRENRVDDVMRCMQPGGDETLRRALIDEVALGAQYVRGYDRDGRAVIYSHITAPKSGNLQAQTVAIIHLLGKAVACTSRKSTELGGSPPLEKYVVVADYTEYAMKHRYPVSTSKLLIQMTQLVNPERLHRLYVVHPPFIFRAVWAFFKPFLDPHTVEKIVFINNEKQLDDELKSRFPDLDKVERFAGGTGNAKEFDAMEYLNLPLDVTFDE